MESLRDARRPPGVSLPGRGARAVLCALTLALPGRAAADDGTEPIRVDVRAPAGCTDTDAFVAEVTARTAKARLAGAGEAARSFTVTITTRGKRAQGTLVIDDPRGAGGARTVEGDSCGEVASALSLVTALAIDPRASTAARPPPRPPPPAPPPPPPPRPRSVELPRRPLLPPYAPLPWWGPIGLPLPAAPGSWPPPRWQVSAVLHAGAASALAPGMTLVLSGSIDVARVGSGILAPAFRFSFLQADSGELTPAASPLLRTRFRWTAGRLEGCPVRLPLGPVVAYPCALVEAGVHDSDGQSPFAPGGTLPDAQHLGVARPWVAPGLLGRLQLAVSGDLVLELQGGATFPLIRDTFYFGPTSTAPGAIIAHAVPAAGGFVSGGVGMHFP